jgi:acetylglutamate kinase/N-acetylglutamate synthase-like GNAT family acetyltransferase
MSDSNDFVRWFRQATPYVHAHRGRTFVILFGGEAVADKTFRNLIHDLALLHGLGIRLVLVHGARPQIQASLARQGAGFRYVKGLRVTDAAALACVKEAAGSLRVEIEALFSQGLANSPMAGVRIPVASGNFVTAKPLGVIEGVDYLHTGVVRRVDREALRQRLDSGAIALMPPIGYSPTGEVFNLSATDVARSTAIALKADKLIFLLEDTAGLSDDQGQLVSNIISRDVATLLEQGTGAADQPDASPGGGPATQPAVAPTVMRRQDTPLIMKDIPVTFMLSMAPAAVPAKVAQAKHSEPAPALAKQPATPHMPVMSGKPAASELPTAPAVALVKGPHTQLPADLAQALRAGADACIQGVKRVHLVSRRLDGALLRELFTRDGVGTLITDAPFEELRPARIDDVAGILELLQPLEEAGVLVRRSRERLETEIDRFYLMERDGMAIATAALYGYPVEGMAELACFAVHPEYRARGRGALLLERMEAMARQRGLTRLFVLTTQTAHWFRERGFEPAPLADLPMAKRVLYNYQRKSKVFIKRL